jgi:hypothetical protein
MIIAWKRRQLSDGHNFCGPHLVHRAGHVGQESKPSAVSHLIVILRHFGPSFDFFYLTRIPRRENASPRRVAQRLSPGKGGSVATDIIFAELRVSRYNQRQNRLSKSNCKISNVADSSGARDNNGVFTGPHVRHGELVVG